MYIFVLHQSHAFCSSTEAVPSHQSNPIAHLTDRFARLFDQTRGESGLLRALRTRMVVDGCHLSALRRIMSVFPLDEVAPVEDVLLQALQETVAGLRTGREATADLRPLAAVLAQLRRYIDAEGEGLTADQVMTEIRQLCDDAQVRYVALGSEPGDTGVSMCVFLIGF